MLGSPRLQLLHAIKKYTLTGVLIPPTLLVQELLDLVSLHAPAPPLVLPLAVVAPPDVQEQRVVLPAPLVEEQRVGLHEIVQEQRVVLPTLAAANPVPTAPLAPLPIVALLTHPYPPLPGLPPLPLTDNPNHLMGVPSISPTVQVAPTRRSSRPTSHYSHLVQFFPPIFPSHSSITL